MGFLFFLHTAMRTSWLRIRQLELYRIKCRSQNTFLCYLPSLQVRHHMLLRLQQAHRTHFRTVFLGCEFDNGSCINYYAACRTHPCAVCPCCRIDSTCCYDCRNTRITHFPCCLPLGFEFDNGGCTEY